MMAKEPDLNAKRMFQYLQHLPMVYILRKKRHESIGKLKYSDEYTTTQQ